MPFYTGIGSRKTPPHILMVMADIAAVMKVDGFTLRSGGAEGADQAFEAGCGDGPKEIYLPWLGFEGSKSTLLPTPAAFEMAAKFHPAWNKCSKGARKMHARNCHQILGHDLNKPSEYVICWTEFAAGGGGTGQAIRIAKAYNIPVMDLADLDTLNDWIETIKGK